MISKVKYDNSEDVQRYIDGVLNGEIVAGHLVRLAVRRHVMDLSRGHERGLDFSADAANQAINFFPLMLTHSTGEYSGQPFELRLFQKFIVWCLFGWRRADGYRRFRDAFVSEGRGNGKSPLGAGIALELFCMDVPREDRAEVYAVATKRDQAKIVWDEAKRFVENSDLKRIVQVMTANLHTTDNYSKFEPLGSDSKNTDGLVPHGVIRDELHEWREKHRGLYDKIETAMGKRRQPLAVTITTAGDDNSEIWKEQRNYSIKVIEQVLSEPAEWFGDDHFSFIAEVDKDDDIYDEGNWPKANPMLRSDDNPSELDPRSPVKIEHLRSMASKAKAGDIISEMRFRRYHCNQMVASVEQPISAELWAHGNSPLSRLDGHVCFGGFDLARSDDFAAIGLVFPVDDHYEVKTWAFTTEHRGDSLKSAEFQTLLRCNNLIVHPGDQIDFADIRRLIADLSETYQVRTWSYDDTWARETAQWLQEEQGLDVVPVKQTPFNYNEPIVKFLDLLGRGRIVHGGDHLLGWQAGNLILRKNAQELRMPDKAQSKNKIDSMVALFMAFRQALFTDTGTSIYEEAGNLTL